ncbi:MAG: transcriptional repressor [Clostridium sp.]|nr:transcriptional repressor [Clostridium sp.]
MSPEKLHGITTEQFARYLQTNKLRATPERWEILKAVYELEGHFAYEDIERKVIETDRFPVSRATLYNTIDHLIRANLLVKHQFAGRIMYEAVVGREPHVHVICTQCGSCTEIAVDSLPALRLTGRKRMAHTHWTAYLFGECMKCGAAERKENKKTTKQ